ncbi:MAG TPA: 4'-phosphopantetheinyl transferase superfamily protein [Polyangia bacterium]|nr:4'-phosphopantetheinyl transferase superfamily protein [Polyangia bacterium]
MMGAAEVHLWLLAAPEEADEGRAARALALLDADERARMSRFHAPEDARRYLFAHALARTALTRYAPEVPPERWRFRAGAHGRPEIADAKGAAATALRFNLSHTAGLVACAVARGRDVGVDVEHLFPPRWSDEACLEIAAAHFAPAEVAALAAEPAERRRARFFEIWTLKEAYTKARGLGLALPLAGFAFDARGPDLRLRCAPSVDAEPEGWRFERLRPTPRHALALAARCAAGDRLVVRICEAGADSP